MAAINGKTNGHAEPNHSLQNGVTDFTLCNICSATSRDPKTLPCLHTFCCACIEKHADQNRNRITCPTCKEETGVSGLRSNFFVASLIEKKALEKEVGQSKLDCTFCDELDNIAVARCLDCKDYLCGACVGIHKVVKRLKSHQVCGLDEIKSGKVAIQTTSGKEYCRKHDDQILWFFCDTCAILICRDCAVVDHPTQSHSLVNVEEVTGLQGKNIVELTSKCEKVVATVAEAIKMAGNTKNKLDAALETVQADAEISATQIKDNFLAKLERRHHEIEHQIAKIRLNHESQINVKKDLLEMQESQLKRALYMTSMVTKTGSPYDVAGMYSLITETLQKLSSVEPASVPVELGEIKFVANRDYELDVPSLGTITIGQGDDGVAVDVANREYELDDSSQRTITIGQGDNGDDLANREYELDVPSHGAITIGQSDDVANRDYEVDVLSNRTSTIGDDCVDVENREYEVDVLSYETITISQGDGGDVANREHELDVPPDGTVTNGQGDTGFDVANREYELDVPSDGTITISHGDDVDGVANLEYELDVPSDGTIKNGQGGDVDGVANLEYELDVPSDGTITNGQGDAGVDVANREYELDVPSDGTITIGQGDDVDGVANLENELDVPSDGTIMNGQGDASVDVANREYELDVLSDGTITIGQGDDVDGVANLQYELDVPSDGTIMIDEGDDGDTEDEWEVEREFGEIAGLKDSMGFALYPNGDLAIADYSNARVKVFNQKGHIKHNINIKQKSLTSLIISKPRSVAISSDGTLFVTDLSPYVKAFDINSKLINQFQTLPSAKCINLRKSSLSGLSKDLRGQIVVGDINNYYISIHKQLDGTHVGSFDISIKPLFLAAAPFDDVIIVSDVSNDPLMVDYSGRTLCTIKHPPSPLGITWRPTGACFKGNCEFIIANQSHSGRPGGIYHYSSKGVYLGCITEDVMEPTNVVLTGDGKLVVLEWTHVKMFKKRDS